MTLKLPRTTIKELEDLVDQLTKDDPRKRDKAMIRLTDFERSGKIPLEVLIEMSQNDHPPLSMYAISALGRNGQTEAVDILIKLFGKHRQSHVLFLETIIDALGETKSPKASAPLLELLGIKTGLVKRLLGRRSKKGDEEGSQAKQAKEHFALPVLRALEKIQDPKAAEKLGEFLDHPDYLVRCHAIQNIQNCRLTGFAAKLKEMSGKDQHELVRESADIAHGYLQPLPPELNN